MLLNTKRISFIFIFLTISGCTTTWDRPNTSEYTFNNDSANCQMVANSSGMQAAAANRPNSYTTYHQGSMVGNSYSGTSNTYATADFSGLAAGIAKKTAYDNCMTSKGYRKK